MNEHYHYSLRAKNLLDHPKFAINSEKRPGFSWRVEYSGETSQFQTDRILTLQYSNQTQDEIQNIFLESFCRLFTGKAVHFLFTVSYREIESFLRDENHIPAFATADLERAQALFDQVKISLLVDIFMGKMALPAEWTQRYFNWEALSLTEKNRALLSLIAALSKLFPHGKHMELVLAEENTVTVKKNDFPLDLEIVEGLMGHLFSFSKSNSPLKVVGTL